MKSFLYNFVSFMFSAGFSSVVWGISFFAADVSYLAASGLGLAGGGLMFGGLKLGQRVWITNRTGMSIREYKFVNENLAEARQQIKRLQKAMFILNDLPTSKKNYELLKKVKRIDGIVQKDPKRFYLAEDFYFHHLNSITELTEKHSFLAKQPHRTPELSQSLMETRDAISSLDRKLNDDLAGLLKGDIDSLNVELDVARRTINKKPLLK